MEVWSVFTSLFVVMITLFIIHIVYKSCRSNRFKKLGIPSPSPWPWLGNIPDLMREGFIVYNERLYKEYADEKMYAIHEPGNVSIVVKDLDLIREICIKKFNCFVNRRVLFDKDPFDNVLTNLKDEHWRSVRNAVSPAFSTGKLKHMFIHIEKTTGILLSNLRRGCREDVAVELKDVMSCFTMDVIASSGFGVQIDSLNNDKNCQFVQHARKFLSSFSGAAVGLAIVFPSLLDILDKIGVHLFPKESVYFFFKFVEEAIARRQEENSLNSRHDLLQLMINAVESSEGNEKVAPGENLKQKLTHGDLQGQSLIFFLAGYETVSTTLSFTLFLLAHHPECCVKIQEEVDRVLGGNPPTYETMQELTYVDMCVNEALRMFPPAFIFDRQCNEDCNIGGVQIPKGVYIMIPVIGIHNDPKLWPEPEKFDPERFTVENKSERHPFAHLPFGQGPRNCIGMRLALMEIKVAVASILQEMTPVPCEKSVYPVVLTKYELKALNGLWVKFVLRQN